ncbi:MAG TPA: hypothetical protein VGH84_01660 [Steroidobacteraceae bacterium]
MNKRDALLGEMQCIVRLAAEPRPPVDSSKGAINRAARALGLSYRRARAFWYGEERALVREAEAARLRAERDRLLRLRLERLEVEMQELRTLLHYAEQRDAAQAGTGADLGHGAAGASCEASA